MMMALDMFIFEIGTLPYQQLRQSWEWRHAQAERFGARTAWQFLGPGAASLSLSGALFPGVAGDFSSIATLREMAASGEAWPLVSGMGEVMGNWFIRRLSLESDTFFVDGVARRGDFTLELEAFDLPEDQTA